MNTSKLMSRILNATRVRNGAILVLVLCAFPVFAYSPTSGTGSVTIYGFDQADTTDCNAGLDDEGTVTITINGTDAETIYYGPTSEGQTSPGTVASALASHINANSTLVSATASSGTVNLTALSTGSGTNYSLAVSTVFNRFGLGCYDDNRNFTPSFTDPSFTFATSGSTLTGGHN